MMYAHYGFWEDWQLYHKVTFDGKNRLILINHGETAIDFETDIYSDWKEWSLLRENGKFAAALRTVGGDPLNAEGDKLGATFFLLNGWRIKTWPGDHTLTIFGNFVVDDNGGLYETQGGLTADPEFSHRAGTQPVIPTEGDNTIQVTNSVSNLVDKINVGGGGPSGEFPTAEEIAGAVWDKVLADHMENGTFGEKVGKRTVMVNVSKDLILEVDD